MVLKYELEFLQIDEDTVAVPISGGVDEFNGVLKVNDTARFILEQLSKDTTIDEIVDNALKRYSGEREEITAFVREYIEILRENDLIKEVG